MIDSSLGKVSGADNHEFLKQIYGARKREKNESVERPVCRDIKVVSRYIAFFYKFEILLITDILTWVNISAIWAFIPANRLYI